MAPMQGRAPHFSMGPGTHQVPMSMHAGARARLLARLRAAGARPGAVVLTTAVGMALVIPSLAYLFHVFKGRSPRG